MNTLLSNEQKATKELYRRFAREFIAPQAKNLEAHQISLKAFLETLGKSGYLGISVPTEFG
ncbi:MAG: acyl-CoA dehydrogenase family protein, partial [Candidatus Melainabacteria bacterium]|nr:acyl-CoA dehydrogenase family protein [Candidatus Melainabacteria bacterium]